MTERSDPLYGKTWKMDPEASHYSTAVAPSEETRVYDEIENGYTLTVTGAHDGKKYSWHYTALYDGQPHPVHGRADVDSIVIYKLDDQHTAGLFSKGLRPAGPYIRNVSEDGRSLTVEAAGRNVDGAPFYDVIEYRL
jgi:hypothetical protein